MKKYIFGYGSLMNPKSLQKTLPGDKKVTKAILHNYQRILNVPIQGYLYLNIKPVQSKNVTGICIEVTDVELEMLKDREKGYVCTDVTSNIQEKINGTIYAFIAPQIKFTDMQIPQSYLDTCTFTLSSEDKIKWLKDTIIENLIFDDTENPVYQNVAK